MLSDNISPLNYQAAGDLHFSHINEKKRVDRQQGLCYDECSSRKCLSEERKKYEISMDVVGSAIVISFFFMVTSIFYFD